MKAICITLPSKIEWADYEKELAAVADGSQVMNFKVPFLPKEHCRRCYVAWRGEIIGWMTICGTVSGHSFKCTTTGKGWDGKFIQRTGEFHYLPDPKPKMKGFQGWRYIEEI